MPVMKIGKMGMAVREGGVTVRMCVRFGTFAAEVRMLVVLIVDVAMGVFQRLMQVFVPVALGQYHPGCHQH